MKGAVDDLDLVIKTLEDNGFSHDRFYIHCDGALFGLMMPFVKCVSIKIFFFVLTKFSMCMWCLITIMSSHLEAARVNYVGWDEVLIFHSWKLVDTDIQLVNVSYLMCSLTLSFW